MKIRDNRNATSKEIGDIILSKGDASLGFFDTDTGYRLIIDTYNLKVISDYYTEKALKEVGKWLRKRLEGERVNSICDYHLEALERGEMPR